MTQGADPGLAYLLTRMRVVESRIRALVTARRAVDPSPDDPFRGLYLSEEAVDRLLGASHPVLPQDDAAVAAEMAAAESAADQAEAGGVPVRLRRLARTFALDDLDVELLLIGLAGDLDARFEQLFGYLNDDVTRRRPSIGVALALCGQPLGSSDARWRFLDGSLVRKGLLIVDDVDRPFPGRAIRVPDRVVAHLLGDDAPDAALTSVLGDVPDVDWGDATSLRTALSRGVTFGYLREPASGSGRVLAAHAVAAVNGGVPVIVDLVRLATENDPVQLGRIASREARLRGSGLIASGARAETIRDGLVSALLADPLPTLFVGEGGWDPAWAPAHPLVVDVAASTPSERSQLWRAVLDRRGAASDVDAGAATEQFLMRPEQVVRAAEAAIVQAQLDSEVRITAKHLQAGARAENGSALQRLARRVEPAVGWVDLVMPAATKSALQEVALRARHRERVLGEWRMRPGGGRGMGVAALFAGDSGTGKTMSAEVVAGELGLDLYVVDLATVVDKYIGETEKNLERIFTAAAGINGVLLFDEADAIFGKRSEVRDAHDRYANVESAYLLQRMESFDGLIVLSTNLRSNIDDAFTRRLDVLVDFPLPDPEHRLVLWDKCLGRVVPRESDIDLDFCANRFELAGGAIRSASVTAAYLAADDGGKLSMRHVITAIHREYRKMGRLSLEHEFGRYYELLASGGTR